MIQMLSRYSGILPSYDTYYQRKIILSDREIEVEKRRLKILKIKLKLRETKIEN